MDQSIRRTGLRSRRFLPLLAATVSGLALLMPATLSADSAAAAPSAGYTASFIPAGTGTSWDQSVAVNPVTDTLYVGEVTTTGYQLVVMDGASHAIRATLALANEPLSIAVNSATNTVYVSEGAPILVIDGAANSVTATISLPGGSASGAIAVNSATNMIYAVIGTGLVGSVVVIDGSTNTVTATASSGGGAPYDIAVDASTDVVWVANERTSTVVAISGASPYSIIHSVSVTEPVRVAFNPDTDTVYVASSGLESNPLTAINGAAYTTTTLPVTDASFSQIAVDPSADVVFVTAQSNLGGGTVVIDGTSNTVADVIAPGGHVAAGDTSTGTEYETSDTQTEPPGLWAVSPSASNGISPLMTGPTTATAGIGYFFGVSFTAIEGLPAPTFTETGPLPAGVTLNPDGQLSGTPKAGTAGVYPITVTASNGIAPNYSLPFTLTVVQAIAPVITSGGQAKFQEGTAGSFTFTATGTPAPTFTWSGALPAGVTLSSAGVLSGTPYLGTAGIYPIQITATNLAGSVTRAVTLTVTPAPLSVGVEGNDRQLWVRVPQLGAGWHPLGGVITAPPAVAAAASDSSSAPADPLFVATGTDQRLWIRSLTAGWQPVGAARCLGGPAAVITGSTLTVACRGTDNALWYTTTTVPSSGLPTFTGPWTSLGGVLSAGPAAAPVGTTMTFFVRGTNGAIFTRTATTGYTQTTWGCIGAPAAAQQTAGSVTTFACQGTNRALWEATSTGVGWAPAVSLGGTLIGGPAVAAGSYDTDFLAEGTDHSVWERSPVGWSSLGGGAVGGAGAAALI